MPHRALITESMYAELVELWHDYQRTGLPPSHNPPQVSVMPSDETLPRILFFGKAPGEIESSENLSEAVQKSAASLTWQIWQRGNSPFWRICRHFIEQIAVATVGNDAHLDQMIGWSNLAKIGGPGWKAQGGRFLSEQISLSQTLMRHELKTAQADAVILMTGNNDYSRRIQEPLFDADPEELKWQLSPNEWLAQKQHPDFGLLFWTDHPQVMSNCNRDYVTDLMVPLIASRWRARTGL